MSKRKKNNNLIIDLYSLIEAIITTIIRILFFIIDFISFYTTSYKKKSGNSFIKTYFDKVDTTYYQFFTASGSFYSNFIYLDDAEVLNTLIPGDEYNYGSPDFNNLVAYIGRNVNKIIMSNATVNPDFDNIGSYIIADNDNIYSNPENTIGTWFGEATVTSYYYIITNEYESINDFETSTLPTTYILIGDYY